VKPWTRVERLDAGHDIEAFTCGDVALDGWLKSSALGAQNEGACGVHLCVDEASVVQAYFSLAFTRLTPTQLPPKGNKRRDFTPALVLAKVGLHSDHQRTGASALLMFEILERAVAIVNGAGGTYLIADVPNPLRHAFYLRSDFKRINDNDKSRFYLKMSSVRAALLQLDVQAGKEDFATAGIA
jgi:hypothetical protein